MKVLEDRKRALRSKVVDAVTTVELQHLLFERTRLDGGIELEVMAGLRRAVTKLDLALFEYAVVLDNAGAIGAAVASAKEGKS